MEGGKARRPLPVPPPLRKPGAPGLRIYAEVGNSRLRMGEGTLAIGVSEIPTKRRIYSLSREAGEGWGGKSQRLKWSIRGCSH
jgi:hypothetical protein